VNDATGVSRTSAVVARFLREARVTGQLEHPTIVPVHEVGRRAGGSYYYSMRVVRGRALGDKLQESKTLADRLSLLSHHANVCSAIAYAHWICRYRCLMDAQRTLAVARRALA